MTPQGRVLAICIGAGLLSLAPLALAGQAERYATEMQVIRGVPGTLDEQERSLIQAQARFHRDQVRAAKDQASSGDDAVDRYAERLVTDNRRAYDKLRTVAAMHGIELGPIDAADQAQKSGGTGTAGDDAGAAGGKTGSREERDFLHARINAEKQALQRLRGHDDSTANPNLAGYVEATIPVVETHLKIARRLAGMTGASADAGLVERGDYLARAGDCRSCHTRDGGQPYAGGRPLQTPYGGTIYTPNITPSRAGIGDFDDEDFLKAMHRGLSPDGEPYYPAFPYPSYTKVKDEDVLAIKAYLDTLEPSDDVPPENDLTWPLGFRDVLWGWRELYFEPGRFKPDPDKSEHWNRGAYLVQGLGHCGSCHTPRNVAGAKIQDQALSGAIRQGWYAPNLTPAMGTGAVSSLSKDALVELLQTGEAPNAEKSAPSRGQQGQAGGAGPRDGDGKTAAAGGGQGSQPQAAATGGAVEVPTLEKLAERAAQTGRRAEHGPGPKAATLGPMAEVVHRSLSYLTGEDLDAIVTYLKDLPPRPSGAGTGEDRRRRLSQQDYHLGKTLYQGWCAACHRDHGQGEAPYVPALADDPVLDEAEPNNVVMSILKGAPAEESQAYSPYVRMPAFADKLTDSEVAALASYMRARWGDADTPKVPSSLAARLRAKLDQPARVGAAPSPRRER